MEWITIARSLFTVGCFAFFIVVVLLAYSKRAKARYEEVANLPFLDDDKVQESELDQAANGARK
ncbi:cbb3-type cytochrome c oxidase subunit 3 [Neisseriaceae bacterium TC5R-5]|nr:cbb3-type cytochrome c oxidase subunit 3 [Neisseriaceae bacterium TC5R-5]